MFILTFPSDLVLMNIISLLLIVKQNKPSHCAPTKILTNLYKSPLNIMPKRISWRERRSDHLD